MTFFTHLLRGAALVLSLLTGSVQAMKYGAPFRFNIISFVGDVSCGNGEGPIVFPQGNTMGEEDIYGQLRALAFKRYESARCTGKANEIFDKEFFHQYEPYLQYFANYITRQHENHSHEYLNDVKYIYSNGLHSAGIGGDIDNPQDRIVLGVALRDLSFQKD